MKTQGIMKSPLEKHQDDKPSAPTLSASLTTFMLKKVESIEDPSSPIVTLSPSLWEISSMPTSISLDGSTITKRSLKHRPWIVHNQFESEDEEEANSKQRYTSLSPKVCLPKGVIRGCTKCSNCQKVLARWDPEGACTFMLEEAPVFYPNEEEFKDTFKYIDSIREQVEPYGFCRIVPPPSWKSPGFLEETDIWQEYKFYPHTERVHELQTQKSCGKASAFQDVRETKRRRLAPEFGDGCDANFVATECHRAENCPTEPGPQFTLISFTRYADYFKQHYFSRGSEVSSAKVNPIVTVEPSEQNIEGEFWRIVEKPTEEIEVLHGINLDSRSLSGGSSVSLNPDQASNFEENYTLGWNLDYISRLSGSLLSFEDSYSPEVLTSRLHIGMCFSSLPWTVEEHQLYKLYYLHLGAPKVWYGTPGCDHYKIEAVIRMHLPDSCEECLVQHHKLLVSPATLKSQDISVYRCIQRPREFVLFLPGAYHSGLDCGFNVSVATAFAPLRWLPCGLNSIELYRELRKKTSISYDKILLRTANEAVKTRWERLVKGEKTPKIMKQTDFSGKDGILARTLKTRIRLESRCREYLSSANQSRRMDMSCDVGDQKRECYKCYYDLYLSASSCPCSPNKLSCLKHAKHLCSCPWSDKVFLYRYLISELNMLLEAVEGKLSAIRSWVKEGLGMALYWNIPKEGQYGHAVDPPSNSEASDGRATPFEKDITSASKLLSEAKEAHLGEISLESPKTKEFATLMGSKLSNFNDDGSSSSSLDSDIDAYLARFHRKKIFPSASHKERESVSNRTGDNSYQQNVSGSSGAVPVSNATSEKDEASTSKLLSEANSPFVVENFEVELATMGIDLSTVSDDTNSPSSSSSSESDVEASIANLRSQKKKKSSSTKV